MASNSNEQVATFAGGCFWCMQPAFDQLDGVIRTIVGYAGGNTKNPSYEQVSHGNSGHAEAIQIVFDPSKLTYETLLEIFWHNIDPTVKNAQFFDVGPQYRTAIFYGNDARKQAAFASKQKLLDSKKFTKIETEIVPLDTFYKAEDYHQEYYKKNPIHYEGYHKACGRDARLKGLWGNI